MTSMPHTIDAVERCTRRRSSPYSSGEELGWKELQGIPGSDFGDGTFSMVDFIRCAPRGDEPPVPERPRGRRPRLSVFQQPDQAPTSMIPARLIVRF